MEINTLTAPRNIIAAWLMLCVTAGASWYEPAWTNHRFAESNLYATNLWALYTNRVTSGAGYTNSFTYPTVIASWSNTAGMVQTQMLLQAADSRSFDVFMAIEERHRCLTWCDPTDYVFEYYREDYYNLGVAKSWIAASAERFIDWRECDDPEGADYKLTKWFAVTNESAMLELPVWTAEKLAEFEGAPTNFFVSSSHRKALTGSWAIVRRMMTNLFLIAETDPSVAVGVRAATNDVCKDTFEFAAYDENTVDWVSSLCSNTVNALFPELEAMQLAQADAVLACDAAYTAVRMYGYWERGTETADEVPYADCITNFSVDILNAKGEHIENKQGKDGGSFPFVFISPSNTLLWVDNYALLPGIDLSQSTPESFACLSGVEEALGHRPRYDWFARVEDDYATHPFVYTNASPLCDKQCMTGEQWQENAKYAYTDYPFLPFSNWWTMVSYSLGTNCEYCGPIGTVEPLRLSFPSQNVCSELIDPWYTMLENYVQDEGCEDALAGEYNGARSDYSFYALDMNRNYVVQDYTNKAFLAVIKYDWEYE